MPRFHEKIRSIRMMKGIKQAEIANFLNIKQQSVSKIENGQIRIDTETAEKLANYLGYSNQKEMELFYEKHINKQGEKY